MTNLNYIISVSEKGILPDSESKGMNVLEQLFSHLPFVQVVEVSRFPWYLSQGMNERIYRATMPEGYPITSDEVKRLKAIFDEEKRILNIYMLKEI